LKPKVKVDQPADPFQERAHGLHAFTAHVMGARIVFQSSSRSLLRLAMTTYHGLPRHRLPGPEPALQIRLLSRADAPRRRLETDEPAELSMFSGAQFLGGATGGSDLVIISARLRTALVAVSQHTQRSPYHARYERLEFAVFTLAARAQGLTSLHAACVGSKGRGVLLMGASGAGKSTATLLAALAGLEFLAEDAVFVRPGTLLATGVSNYLHVTADTLKWLDERERAWVRASPVIRRRSGVRKFELDLRRRTARVAPVQLARSPLKICAVVFLSAQPATSTLLRPLSKAQLLRRTVAEQGYAASQPQWPQFSRSLASVPGFELRRADHPAKSVAAIQTLLEAL
jgi:hypothetical protein